MDLILDVMEWLLHMTHEEGSSYLSNTLHNIQEPDLI
jgi:hypothetical protein